MKTQFLTFRYDCKQLKYYTNVQGHKNNAISLKHVLHELSMIMKWWIGVSFSITFWEWQSESTHKIAKLVTISKTCKNARFFIQSIWISVHHFSSSIFTQLSLMFPLVFGAKKFFTLLHWDKSWSLLRI